MNNYEWVDIELFIEKNQDCRNISLKSINKWNN